MKEIDLEKLKSYYIDENHTLDECAALFDCGKTTIWRFCKKNGIEKGKGKGNNNIPAITDIEEFKKYYIEENHTREECCKKYNCSLQSIQTICSKYNIAKDREKINENISNAKSDTIIKNDEVIIKGIKLKDLIQYYIIENHNQKETASYFNCSVSTIQRICKQENIKKSKRSIAEKRSETIKKIYGVDNAFQSEEIKEKIKNTIMEKYGVENISQNQEIKEKKKETCLKNYGVENPMLNDKIKQEVLSKSIETCIENYGVPYYVMTSECQEKLKNSSSSRIHSKPNDNFATFLSNNNIIFEREYNIELYSYDFKIENKLIEINPTATHNTEWTPFGDHISKLERYYHRDKRNLAIKNNYSCMMIWDWDNKNAIYNYFIGHKDRIYARECEIKKITEDESKVLLNEYHFQGYAKAKVTYGLFYNNELISVMSFDKPRYNHNYQWEIIRYCSSKNIIGGAEKLFKHFVEDNNAESIVSYCDISKFSGNTYEKLGFKKIRTSSPTVHWYNLKDHRHFTDNLIRSRGVSRIVNGCEPEDDPIAKEANTNDNYTLMLLNGFLPVYDCGQATYGWQKEKPLE